MRAHPASPRAFLTLKIILSISVAAGVSGQTPPAPPQTQPVFRGASVLVPVDVRVLDRDGKPVTDLNAGDFTITENGIKQTIRQFATQQIMPVTGEIATAPLRRTGPLADQVAPQTRRVFLLFLGRGRLQEPSKGIDATLRFVKERLLPQDQVAVMAWNRATDFTTDHARIARVIERFRSKHELVEALLVQHFGGGALAGLYASPENPKEIQELIDEIFTDPESPAREVMPGTATRDAQRAANDMANLLLADGYRLFGGTDVRLGDLMGDTTFGMNFDEYVALSRQTMSDVGDLYAGIEYLRFIEGEKHLVFVTEYGILLPSADDDRGLAAKASDARVAIDTIQTGGVETTGRGDTVGANVGFKLGALRTLAEGTGGQGSASEYADKAYDRILNATGFTYVLGYAPMNRSLDGRYRKIEVEVKRKDVNVSYRRGYFAREDDTFDPRRAMSEVRLTAALTHPTDVDNLKLAVKVTNVRDGNGPVRAVNVETTIAADRIVFAMADGRHLAALHQVILFADEQKRGIGQLWRTLDMKVPPALLDQARKTGLKTTVQVPVQREPYYVKVIVYDYGSDLIGILTQRVGG